MNQDLKEIIRTRAFALLPAIRDELNRSYEIRSELGEAFKWCYLVLYGPKRFLEKFREAKLLIELNDIRNVYTDYNEYIGGKYGLMDEEIEMIKIHNHESMLFLNRNSEILPYKNSSIGLHI
jgi:hypothetical protein